MNPINDEQILWTFSDTFTNNSKYEQIYNTESYSKTVSNSHSFSIKLSEKISQKINIKSKFKIPFIDSVPEVGIEMGTESSSEQQWSETITEQVTVTAPSQAIKTSPNSILNVLYIIKQGVYDSKGIINFEVKNINEKIFNIPRFYFTETGDYINVSWSMFSISDIINVLKDGGYTNQIKNNSHKYSIITIDNPEEPNRVYLNLPITWQSQGSKIEVSHYEESLVD